MALGEKRLNIRQAARQRSGRHATDRSIPASVRAQTAMQPPGPMDRRRSSHGRNRVYNEDVLRTVKRTIARYGMFRPGERVAVAVSGGPDSVALLHVLRQLAPALEISLSMAHVNHQLRGAESAEDERFVAELAARLGLTLHLTSVDTAAEARRRRENLEQVGRKTRYQWFTQLRENGFTDLVCPASF